MSMQRTNIPKQAPLAQFQAHKAENYFFQLSINAAVAGVVQAVQGPNFRIPPGAQITLRSATPATATAGQGDVYMSTVREDLNGNLANVMVHIFAGSTQLLAIAVDNLNELWFGCSDLGGGAIGISVVVPALE